MDIVSEMRGARDSGCERKSVSESVALRSSQGEGAEGESKPFPQATENP